MTATITPHANTKDASPPKLDAIHRIHDDLDKMVSRLRREIWIGGTLVVGTVTMTSLLVILAIDTFFQPESAWLRASLWLPLIASVVIVAQRFLVMPVRQECDRLAMAWTLEQKRPAIEERLTTSLQLTETPNRNASSLVEAVAQQAHGSLDGCQEEDLRGQEILRRIIVAGTCLLTFVLAMWIWAPYLIPSLQNVLNPWSARVLPHLNAAIMPGDTHVEEGGNLKVTATANHLTEAMLEVIENDAVIESHQMATDANGRFAEFTLTRLNSDRQYRVRSGGLYSGRHEIIVDPKPVIERFNIELRFPEYTRLAPQVLNKLSGPIDVIHGTHVRIAVDSTLPCAESSLTLNETSIPFSEAAAVEETGRWRNCWEFTATASDQQNGIITLVSEAGVESEPFLFELRTLPDLPPSIMIEKPALSEIRAKADHSIDLKFQAFDDFGCGSLNLISQKNDEPPSIKESSQESDAELSGELTVNLNELQLATGDQFIVWLSITDNRPDEFGGRQVTDSRKIRFQIADDAIPVGQQIVRNEQHPLLIELTEAIKDLQQASEFAKNLQAEFSDIADLSQAPVEMLEKSNQLQDQIKDAEQVLRQLSDQDELAPQRLFQPELERIQEVTDNEVSEAKKQAGLVPLSDDLVQQQAAVAATKDSVNDAIEELEKVREDIRERGKQMELAAQLDELARQQERLAQEFDERQDKARDVQGKQQQVADALQEVVEQDLDAKSEQFAQRAEKASKLAEKAEELQKQQEELTNLDQIRSKEELGDQLLDMIAREQEQIKNETRKLAEQNDVQPPSADAGKQTEQKEDKANEDDQSGLQNSLAESLEKMESVPEKLRNKDLDQAETDAQQAGERLQEESQSAAPHTVAKQPKRDDEEEAQRKEDDLKRLAKQQERVRAAIEAVRQDRPEEAIAKLQEQIADRTERLRDKADELLQLPTEDPENQQAVREAREKLEQAEKETRSAEQLTTPESKQDGASRQAAEEQKQAGGLMQPDERKKQNGDPKQASDDQKQADDTKQTGQQDKQDGDPQNAIEQKKQAAKSLQEATQALEKVCKSCQKCSNCNKPSASRGSNGGEPKKSGQQSLSKKGDQSEKSQPGPKSGKSGQSSPQEQHPDSKKLAESADKAHQTAQSPSPERTQELAKELNQLADDAAQQAGFANRNSKSDDAQSKPPTSSTQAGTPQPGNSSQPQGVNGKAGENQSKVAPTQLRGRSTSNWTQSRRKLNSNVLDNQDSKIPEEFRSVVKDYFEELSRLESRQNNEEGQE